MSASMRRIHACAIWIFVCNSIRFCTKKHMTLFESKWLFVCQERSVCWNVYKLCFYCFWYVFFSLIMLKLSRNQIIIQYKIPCIIIHKGPINRVDCFMRQIDSSIHIKKKNGMETIFEWYTLDNEIMGKCFKRIASIKSCCFSFISRWERK